MLSRLIKYEMKAMGRIMLPLYAILLIGSGVIAIWIRNGLGDNPLVGMVLRRLSYIFVVLFVLFAFATAMIMALLVIQRFYKNLLGTEGYLMFTLPVTTAENILSKMITSLVWILLGIGVGGLSGLTVIIGAGGVSLAEFMEDLDNAFQMLFGYIGNGSAALGCVLALLLLITGILKSLAEIYAAMAVGQLWNDHKVLGGVLAYIGFSIIEMLLMQLPFIQKLQTAMETAMENMTSGAGSTTMMGLILIAAAGFAVYYAVAWTLLDKKLNLE